MNKTYKSATQRKLHIYSVVWSINNLYFIPKYSAIGPSDNAGKKLNAATINITAKIIMPNVDVSVLSVPELSGTYFFFARIPAIATGPMMGRKRDSNITMPQVTFQKGTPSPRP